MTQRELTKICDDFMYNNPKYKIVVKPKWFGIRMEICIWREFFGNPWTVSSRITGDELKTQIKEHMRGVAAVFDEVKTITTNSKTVKAAKVK